MKMCRWLLGALVSVALLGLAPVALATSSTATITGTVIDQSTGQPISGAEVSTQDASTNGWVTAQTDASGAFTLSGLSPGTYTVSATASPDYQPGSSAPLTLAAGESQQVTIPLQPAVGNLTGRVTDSGGAPLAGMQIQLADSNGVTQSGWTAYSGPNGNYTITGVPNGAYTVTGLDGVLMPNQQPVDLGSATVNGATTTDDLAVPAPQVPPATTAQNAARDLSWLNAERVANGLPGGIVLNPRWSTDCAAHDAYERANGGTLTHYETSGHPGWSPGGWWVGTTSILAVSTQWTAPANPFETAPIHLNQLYSPSLSVVGLDDSNGFQCVTTWAGMQATFAADTVSTYPGNGVHGVPPSENAAESPYVPGQFVGLPEGTTAGRELFVYFNQAGQMGQAQVQFASASLSGPQGAVAIKTVDNTTPTVGPALAGGIIIPVKPLAANTTYTASVTLVAGSHTVSHAWSFTTGASASTSPPPKPTCKVPKLTNLTLTAARRALAKANCRLGKVRRAHDRDVKKGRVVSQSTRRGRVLPARAAIGVVVSVGPRH